MESKIKKARLVSRLLDSQFEIGGIRFGLDPLFDIIPYFGDVAGAALSLYIINIAREVGVSKIDMAKMVGNIAVDFALGFPPFFGVVLDILWKANDKNIKILEKYSHGKFVEGQIVG